MDPPDNAEKGIRIGCGFVLGLVIGAVAALRIFYDDANAFMVMTIVVAMVFGLAALRFGDSFWRFVLALV